MSNKRYPEELKIEAVKQITERDHSVPDVAKRLGALEAKHSRMHMRIEAHMFKGELTNG